MNETWYAICPKGVEEILKDELMALGVEHCKLSVAAVAFQSDIQTAYRVMLWSRLANRVLLPLKLCDATSADALYADIYEIDWAYHFTPQTPFRVDCTGSNRAINNTHFGALRVKDAIVDKMRDQLQERPTVDKSQPGFRVNLHIKGATAQLSIDMSGESLHRRDYRLDGNDAPLKENLACALLTRAGWPAMCADTKPLIDPFCGSGTLLVEAAFMALDRAPGLRRKSYGFHFWLGHTPNIWDSLLEEAEQRHAEAVSKHSSLSLFGFDASGKAVRACLANIRSAGLQDYISVEQRELAHFSLPKDLDQKGLIITNPPYGERLSELPVVTQLYQYLGYVLHKECSGWDASVFTSQPELGKMIGLRADKYYKFFNGPLPCRLLNFKITEDNIYRGNRQQPAHDSDNKPKKTAIKQSLTESTDIHLNSQAQMLANRLKKNQQRLAKWIKANELECYRLYDADLPEYNVAVDVYKEWFLVQEYKAPAHVDEQKARARLHDAMLAVAHAYQVPLDRIIVKQRQKQSGKAQYQRMHRENAYFTVREGAANLLVNLTDFLDTGLFLDHRPMRQYVFEHSKNQRFLNLFCYTASVSVHAGLGGAKESVSVDMSKTYTDWAKKNLALNGLSYTQHKVVQADCFEWLLSNHQKFDVIFLDPPTFSNSKRMDDSLDIQRDHVKLIKLAAKSLEKSGTLIFSNNFRKFQLDIDSLTEFSIENITKKSIPKDFERNSRIHTCWKLSFKA